MSTFNNYGYPNTIRLSNQLPGKHLNKRKTFYDKSHLDLAVDMVIKNKLSMRAASHIYNIPFSTLRTRKVFLTSGLPAAEYDKLHKKQKKLGNVGNKNGQNNSNNNNNVSINNNNSSLTLNENEDDNYEDFEDNFEDEMETEDAAMGIDESNKNGLNGISNELLIKNEPDLTTNRLNNGQSQSAQHILSKNSPNTNQNFQKRLYIKHDKLDKIISKGITSVKDLLDEDSKQNKMIHHQSNLININGSVKSYINNNNNNINRGLISNTRPNNNNINMNGNGNRFRVPNAPLLANNGQRVQTNAQKPNSPFKLSSILSTTTLSLKNKTSKSPQPAVHQPINKQYQQQHHQQHHQQQKQQQSKLSNNNIASSNSQLTQKKIVSSCPNSDFLTRSNENERSLFKCKTCSLLFINSYFLNEHVNAKHAEGKKEDRIVYADTIDKCKYFTCSFCNITTLDKISFLAHINSCSV